jgi:hypothetical protein
MGPSVNGLVVGFGSVAGYLLFDEDAKAYYAGAASPKA